MPQHVEQRGNNREPCFFAEENYQRYLDDLSAAATKYSCRIHAYVLMTHHLQLLTTPMMEHEISQCMQALGRRYVRYINHTYKRSGTLWEGRYRSSLIDSDHYLLTCMRYIEWNPVRADMVNHPGEYRWSSYGANAQGKLDRLIEPHHLYLELDSVAGTRLSAYRELFRVHVDTETLHEVRESVNLELVLGRSCFKDRIEQMTQRQTRVGKPGRPRIEEDSAAYHVHY
jgi:putative transposase